jgi:hypothetical protein
MIQKQSIKNSVWRGGWMPKFFTIAKGLMELLPNTSPQVIIIKISTPTPFHENFVSLHPELFSRQYDRSNKVTE